MTARLSLAMIVRDEEELLGRVLVDAVKVCEELVVIDTGSSDRTRDVAERYGAAVYDIDWRDDFATARNASFAWCHEEWILWLDADDILPASTIAALGEVKALLGGNDDVDAVRAPYHYRIADNGTVVIRHARERILRRTAGLRWEGTVQESISAPEDRTVFVPELVIEHRPDAATRARNRGRTLRIVEREIAGGHPAPRILFRYANELRDQDLAEEASLAYREYLHADRNPGPDRYWAQVSLAALAREIGDETTIRETALEAIGEDPGRAEAYVTLGRYYYDLEQWARAAPLFSAATLTRQPKSGITRRPDYQYVAWDYLSICLDRLGRSREAFDAATRALPNNPEADRIRGNMRWFVDRM